MKSWRYRDLSCILENSQSLGAFYRFCKEFYAHTICLMLRYPMPQTMALLPPPIVFVIPLEKLMIGLDLCLQELLNIEYFFH
jgi:hypothetical protein